MTGSFEEFTERQMQSLIEKMIKDGSLPDCITNRDDIDQILENIGDQNRLKIFTVDYLVRKSAAKAAKSALDALNLVEFVSADKSISSTHGEILRPDFVTYNPEENSVILFELKKDSQTAREAVTELIAYEQEIQNHLPFTSHVDTHFVLVIKEWSVALNHAISNLVTWARRSIVVLELTGKPSSPALRIILPDAWKSLASIGLPKESLSVVSLCLYPKLHSNGSDKRLDSVVPRHLLTATNAIARDGDRMGAHGFVLLWRDYLAVSECKWMMTIGSIDPYKFFMSAKRKGVEWRQNDLVRYLEDNAGDLDVGNHPNSLFRTAKRARDYLCEWWDPRYEGFSDWETERWHELRGRARPVIMDAWGVIGEHLSDITLDRIGMAAHMPEALESGEDWRSPALGISIIDEMLGDRPLNEGVLTVRNCWRLGFDLGLWEWLDRNCAANSGAVEDELSCYLEWQVIRIRSVLNELRMMYYASEDLEENLPVVVIGAPAGDAETSERRSQLIDWVAENLIGIENVFHHSAFFIGYMLSPLFDLSLKERISEDGKSKIRKNAELPMSIFIAQLAQFTITNAADGPLSKDSVVRKVSRIAERLVKKPIFDLEDCKEILKKKPPSLLLAAEEIFESEMVELADILLPPVWHKLALCAPTSIDWGYFKEGVARMFAAGERYPCVILNPDGGIGTGACNYPGIELLAPINDPESEVFFWNRMPGLEQVSLMSWQEIIDYFTGRGLND